MEKTLQERLQDVHSIPLKEIIEAYGGIFLSNKQFMHPNFGYEKTPSGFIYSKNGIEYWKHFKENIGGDAIDFVKQVCGIASTKEAIDKILGNDINYNVINAAENRERIINEKKEKINKDRKKIFAILKNSVELIDSDLGIEYFKKRGIDRAALNLQDPNINIRVNNFFTKDDKVVNNICYLFNGNKKLNTHRFMVIKGMDCNAEKNGLKLNLMECRPVIHESKCNRPFLIVEGIEDGLSGKELGYNNFICLNSTSGINKLICSMNFCRKWFIKNSFEVCLDNDKAGNNAIKKLKTFTNLASMYESNNLNKIKRFIKDEINFNEDKKLNLKKCTLKLLNDIKDIKKENNDIVIQLINNITKLLPDDYFKDYGSTFNIKNSKYYNIMKQLDYNDLNELLVKEYKMNLQEVLNYINDIEEACKENAR